ncbi:MAG: NADH:ubiquinone reductase (Na(+)-transporting) subunit A, partial [Muribaculaceae bacterium]|nr:NADH:ubiquinone reductase (Na(+)-transporting) subunit A [Muribaculaceae bacterium]
MSIAIKIRKGLDLNIEGKIDNTDEVEVIKPAEAALIPDDFHGMVPKMEVREGDEVLAGQPLWHDKRHEEIKVTSPVSGIVKAIVRGERRKILRVVVGNSSDEAYAHDATGALTDAAKAKSLLCASGIWAMMTQRPYA